MRSYLCREVRPTHTIFFILSICFVLGFEWFEYLMFWDLLPFFFLGLRRANTAELMKKMPDMLLDYKVSILNGMGIIQL